MFLKLKKGVKKLVLILATFTSVIATRKKAVETTETAKLLRLVKIAKIAKVISI